MKARTLALVISGALTAALLMALIIAYSISR